MDKITETYINLNEAAPSKPIKKLATSTGPTIRFSKKQSAFDRSKPLKKLTNNQTMKVLDVLEDLRVKGSTKSDLKYAVKALKTIDGKVKFDVKKHIKALLAAADSLFVLEKLAEVESDRLDATLEVGGPALSIKGSSPKSRR